MGIEELIERLEGASCLTTNRYYKDGFNGGIRHALELAKEYKSSLPTQQDKVVVPPMIDKYLNVGNKAQKLASLVSNKYTMLDSDESDSELKQWLKEISMNDLLSLYNGYTVEKEQLYYVSLPFVGFLTDSYDNPTTRCKEDAARSTEKEIKSLSLDYWAFAVPVEEESR